MTNCQFFTQQLGNGLRTLNTLSQSRDHQDYRVSMYLVNPLQLITVHQYEFVLIPYFLMAHW